MTNFYFNWEETKNTLLDITGLEECCFWGEFAMILEKFLNAMKDNNIEETKVE